MIDSTGKGLYLRGWIKHDVIKAKTRYGEITVNAEELKALVFKTPDGEIEGNITIKFSDGSRLGGKLSQEKIELVSEYGKMDVPLKSIVSITIGKEEDIIMTKKEKLHGKIEQEEFELESQIGKIKIKKKQIAQITTGKARVEEGNVALGAKVTGSGNDGYSSNEKLTDGVFSSVNYAHCQLGKSMTVELNDSFLLSATGIFLYNDGRFCRYYIEVSNDGQNWTKVVDKQQGEHRGWQVDKFDPTPVKYIKVTGTHCSLSTGNLYLLELEAYCNSENIRTPTLQNILKKGEHWEGKGWDFIEQLR